MLTRQPQITAVVSGRWKSKGLRCCYLPNTNQPVDLSGNGFHSSYAACTLSVDGYQASGGIGTVKAWTGNGAVTARATFPKTAINAVGGVTWLAVVYADSFPDRSIIANTDTGEGSSGIEGVTWRAFTDGTLQLVYNNTEVLATGPIISSGVWYALAMRYKSGNGSSGGACTFAVNGVLTAGSSVSNTAPATSANSTPCIMAESTALDREWVGKVALFANFDSLLGDGDLVALTRNPWQIFADPAEGRMRFIRAAYVPAVAGTFQNIVGRPFSLAGVHGLAGD